MKRIICFFDTSNFGYGNYNGYATLKDFQYAAIFYFMKLRIQREYNPFIIKLITDVKGAEVMKKTYLDFDEVEIIDINSFTKFEILKQNEGYLCVNLDVIPFSHLSIPIYSADIVVQEIIPWYHHSYELNNFVSKFEKFNKSVIFTDDVYEMVKENIEILSGIRFGIIGGNDVTLLKKYVEAVRKFKTRNPNVNDKFFEMVYSYYFFKLHDAKIKAVVPNVVFGKNVLTLYDKEICIQFSELSKRNPIITEATKTYVRNFYPSIYKQLHNL